MEIFQWASNPWGEEVLIRISWNLLYVFTIAGLAFLVMHALYVRFWVPQHAEPTPHTPGRPPTCRHVFHGTPSQPASFTG